MFDPLSHLPLASAAVWIAIGAFHVRGRAYRVSTGAAFIATAFLLGLYAFQEWLRLGLQLSLTDPGPFPLSEFSLVLAAL
ncbi:MAG: hypothetical protein V3W28_06520, partial [Thermoplasmata archaeon]